jgi:multidrug efflux pump subunit AcrB
MARQPATKAQELILHLLIATLSVTVLIWIFLGWREAAVVLVAVPVTLALTLFASLPSATRSIE